MTTADDRARDRVEAAAKVIRRALELEAAGLLGDPEGRDELRVEIVAEDKKPSRCTVFRHGIPVFNGQSYLVEGSGETTRAERAEAEVASLRAQVDAVRERLDHLADLVSAVRSDTLRAALDGAGGGED